MAVNRGLSAGLKCTAATVMKQKYHVRKKPAILALAVTSTHSICTKTQGNTHAQETKTHAHFKAISSLKTSHPNSCDIEQLSFNLQEEMQAEPQDEKRCHISHSDISPVAISSDFIIHYARDNLLL